ncbi:hypothetical protein GmHk_05G013058 [Glycine max]|nr:hypothetical protein GmHk_05G013058 [Glycine max]
MYEAKGVKSSSKGTSNALEIEPFGTSVHWLASKDSKFSPSKDSKSSPLKVVVDDSPKKKVKKKVKGEKGREINGKIGNDVVGRKSDKKAKPDSTTRATIKEVVTSASQAMTSLAKKFNEEDKQRIAYMGTSVLVVALGVYATYKLHSRVP